MRRFVPLAVLLGLAAPAWAQDGVRLGTYRAQMEASAARIEWQMEAEPGVVAFDLRRRTATSNGAFVTVATLRPHGAARMYEYVDASLYKGNEMALAEYQVEATFAGGARVVLFSAPVNYTTTSIRRTWGSIKAMFQ
ncbi:MAG: hypothetical protein IAE99_06360 [Rhodothermales bacterium]|nr:hypothetical protein [Rhodothermales bacterium]